MRGIDLEMLQDLYPIFSCLKKTNQLGRPVLFFRMGCDFGHNYG